MRGLQHVLGGGAEARAGLGNVTGVGCRADVKHCGLRCHQLVGRSDLDFNIIGGVGLEHGEHSLGVCGPVHQRDLSQIDCLDDLAVAAAGRHPGADAEALVDAGLNFEHSHRIDDMGAEPGAAVVLHVVFDGHTGSFLRVVHLAHVGECHVALARGLHGVSRDGLAVAVDNLARGEAVYLQGAVVLLLGLLDGCVELGHVRVLDVLARGQFVVQRR